MKYLTKNKAWDIVEDYNLDKLLYLLIDRPNYNNPHDSLFWNISKGIWHRKYDFPAVVFNSGECRWYISDVQHRENNKPAFINSNGYIQYWLNGLCIK